MAGYPLHISMSNLRFTTMAFALLLVVLAALLPAPRMDARRT